MIGEVNAQATSDLLRTPALCPAAVLARAVTAPAPADLRTRDAAVGLLHRPDEPVLHIGPQLQVDRELGRLGSSRAAVGMRLRGRRPILKPTGAPPRCVAAPWKSSTAPDPADGRSPAPRSHERPATRSPPAR